jgi:signal transduction histidine kinase
MISLQNRLTLTYATFISIALVVLITAINHFTSIIFTGLIKENSARKSEEIVQTMSERYDPVNQRFDEAGVEAIGMYFVHEGYIMTLRDERERVIWDARSCNMQQCSEVINGIAERMKNDFGLNGSVQTQQFPLQYNGKKKGNITLETYGPFFYSEAETQFLSSINKLLIIAGAVFIVLTILISILLSGTIARPILKAKEAARRIAAFHRKSIHGANHDPAVRIYERYQTTELAELSRAINELAEELEEGERRQKQLTSDIAHELRTPLTCLQGTIEAMIDGVWKADKERLISCHEELMRLTRLVQDLNTLTTLEWNNITLNKTDFDLAKLLYLTAEQFMPAAREKGLAMTLHLQESPITADYDRLKQVFINLLSNALKYTDAGSISISIERETDAPHYALSITDTGIGIPERDIPHIFERFFRSDKSRNRTTGGAGIGLTIAAAIIAAHEGAISVKSTEAGSDVVVRL